MRKFFKLAVGSLLSCYGVLFIFLNPQITLAQGLICSDPVPAVVGSNTVPSAPYWYTYTAPRDETITLISTPSGVDTFLEVISDCAYSTVYISNDFIDVGFLESYGTITLTAGQSILIHWADYKVATGFDWQLLTEPEIDYPSLNWFPADNSTNVPLDVNNFVLPFKKDIWAGNGNVSLVKTSNDSTISYFAKTANGSDLSLMSSIYLEPNTDYHFIMGSSFVVFDKLAFDSWPLNIPFPDPRLPNSTGISDPSIWNFTTGTLDSSIPYLINFSPSIISTNIGLNISLGLTFNEPIRYSDPAIISLFRKADNSLVADIDLMQRGSYGNTSNADSSYLLVDLSGLLGPATEYYVNIPSDIFYDRSGKVFAGISDDTTWTFTTSLNTNVSDSLALVNLYNDNNGDYWVNNENWNEDLVATWDGVVTNGGRVTKLDLRNSGIKGSLSSAILNLTALDTLDLYRNSLDSLPNLSLLASLAYLDLSFNLLEFGELEPLIGSIPSLIFSNQTAKEGNKKKILKNSTSYTMSAPAIDGTGVTYSWFKDGVIISGETTVTYSLSNFQATDAGNYSREATSALVPGLIISNSFAITADTTTVATTSIFEWVIDGDVVEDISQSSYGSNWIDIDNDGDEDLYVNHWLNSSADQPNYLYENLGDGTFKKVTSGIITEIFAQRFVSWADYDNNGLPDLICNLDVQNTPVASTIIYRNLGSFSFERINTAQTSDDGYGTTWADINLDGNLDIIRTLITTGNTTFGQPMELLLGDGAGNFTLTNSISNLRTDRNLQVIDYDNDGDQDIYIADHASAPGVPYLLVNDGTGNYDKQLLMNVERIWSGSWGDIENDGDMDLFFMDRINAAGYFMLNDGAGALDSIPMQQIVGGDSISGRGSAFGDINNDGFLDLVAGDKFAQSVAIYLNNGTGMFNRVSDSVQLFQTNSSNGSISLADYDNDGYLDLFYSNYFAGNELYHNRGNSNNWLKIKLDGVHSNKDGIGARIVVSAGSLNMTRQIQTLTGAMSSNSKLAHYGLASNTTADITVYWPSGLVQKVTGVSSNQQITITEDVNTRAALLALYSATDGPNWVNNSNWNTAAPMDTWYGVTAIGDSVSHISLAFNNLNGTIPPEIGDLTDLTYLWLGRNFGLAGIIPPEIGQLQNLDTLGFSYTSLTGSIPDELFDLSNLLRFSMSNSQVSGSLSPRISNLTNLKHIALWNTPLSGDIPNEFWDMTQLERIYLGTNEQGGEISPKIGEFSNLEEFWISGSNLTGIIPPEIGNANTVTLLNIFSNNLYGPVPDEINNLTQLKRFEIQSNDLDFLPEIIGLDSLQIFKISDNKFTYGDILPNQSFITENTGQQPFGDSVQVQAYTFEGLRLDPELEIIDGQQYQWYKDNVALSDGTGHYYFIDDFREGDGGVFYLTVTHPDVNSLTLTRNPMVVSENTGDPPKPEAVEVISPNGDGINDEMTIKNIELYPQHRVLIYDVLGRLVYFTTEYDNINNPFIGIGNQDGFKELPSGTYYYLIDVGDTKKNGTGFFVMKLR